MRLGKKVSRYVRMLPSCQAPTAGQHRTHVHCPAFDSVHDPLEVCIEIVLQQMLEEKNGDGHAHVAGAGIAVLRSDFPYGFGRVFDELPYDNE